MSRFNVVPPSSSTGVETTHPNSLVSLVDWVSATFHGFATPDELMGFLGFNSADFRDLKTGNFGYLFGKTFEHCTFFWGTPDHATDMGIHMVLSGQGCRFVESTFTAFTWFNWLTLVHGIGGKFSRLDLAIDDYVRSISLNTVGKAVRSGEVVSHFRTARDFQEFTLEDGSSVGRTIYFGSVTSDLQIRFYDKRSERLAKGYQGVPDFYNRYEIQFMRDRANAAVVALLDGLSVSGLILGVLNASLSFRKKNGDSNKSRWPVASWWVRFLSDVEKIKLYVPRAPLTIPKKIDWIIQQTSKSYRMVSEALCDDKFLLDSVLAAGSEKDLKPTEKLLVSEFRQSPDRDLAIDHMFQILDRTKFFQKQKKHQRYGLSVDANDDQNTPF